MNAPLLHVTDVSKRFGSTQVLSDVSLSVEAGKVLCLLGDNGAGKSTLIKILSGVHAPTSGQIELDGQPVSFRNSKDASRAGIATVHQFGGTFPLMTIGRSFFAGAEPVKGFWPFKRMNTAKANDVAVRAIQELGITRVTDGSTLVGGMSGGERQALAIARAVHFGARVLILDEPTAALGVREAAHVLRIIMQARQAGVGVVLVTHNVTHAVSVGDHFAVLIHGQVAADFKKGEKSRDEITELMAGGRAMNDLEAELAAYQADAHGDADIRPSTG